MQWERALISLAEMRDAGIKANSFVYSAAIDACAKVHHPLNILITFFCPRFVSYFVYMYGVLYPPATSVGFLAEHLF